MDVIGNPASLPLGERRCTAHNRAGERCKKAPILGGFVCAMHGGKSPLAIDAARRRLMELVEPAIGGLLRAINSGDPCPHCGRADDMSVVVRAAQVVLDRTGLGPSSSLAINTTVPDEARLEDLTPDELALEAEKVTAEIRDLAEKRRERLLSQGAANQSPTDSVSKERR